MDRHEDSYKISKDGVVLYFLRGLDKIVHFNHGGKETTFYVYESHTPFNKWLEDPDNVIQDGSYTKNFLPRLRKSQRTKNFSVEEDKLIVSTWLNTSKDAITGNEEQGGAFWQRILQYLKLHGGNHEERSQSSIKSR